jgi:hypothetical protein
MLDKKNDLTGEILGISLNADKLELSELDENISIINRRFNYLMKNKVLNDLQVGNVIPVFNTYKINLPHFLPVFSMMSNNKPISVVNLTNYGRKDKDKLFNIDNRTLFALLQTGTVARETILNWNQVSMNTTIIKNSAIIYSKMFSKVLDKMFAINLDRLMADTIYYLTAKFFLLFQMEKKENEITNNIAYQAINNDSTKNIIFSTDSGFTEDAYSDLNSFVENLSTINGLSKLTTRGFIENWMMMYGDSTVFALEYFPLFCHAIFSAMINAHLNKEFVIEPLASKETTSLYNELGRIFR